MWPRASRSAAGRFRPAPATMGLLRLAVCAWIASQALALAPDRPLGQYGLRKWTNESGLPQNSVHCIVQLRSGYICLGTQEGLVRFDGVRFRAQAPYNTPGLRSGKVNNVLEAPDGGLWLGTIGGGLHWLPLDGAARAFTREQGLDNDTVQTMAFDTSDQLVVTTAEKAYRWERDGFRPLPFASAPSGATFTDICSGPQGRTWFATSKGLYFLDQGQLRPYPGGPLGTTNRLTSLAPGKDDALWVGAYDGGIFRVDKTPRASCGSAPAARGCGDGATAAVNAIRSARASRTGPFRPS